MKQVGDHEFEEVGGDVWACLNCHMEVVDGHFRGVENIPCQQKTARSFEL